jgi:cytochrome c oxidase assembly protein subunit 15
MTSFRKLTIATLVAVYILILVGGIVRSSGSGMGCPDWPKCFGSWTPPRSVNDLPDNYKEIYANYRDKKNQKFARYLRLIGLNETANRLVSDKAILHEADFNPTKTWIEYFNRIVGVIIGFLIILVFVVSWKFRANFPSLTRIALISLVLVIFQGWFGSIVVSTNLTSWTITIHMFLALLQVALLIWLVYKTSPMETSIVKTSVGYWWTLTCMAVLLVQILLGTRVREAIDVAAGEYSRDRWIFEVWKPFIMHRSFSWIVVLLGIGLIVNLRKTQGLKPFPLTVIMLILGTILTGAGMGYFGIPAWLQPLHLLLATVTFGMQFMLLLKLKGNVESESQLK